MTTENVLHITLTHCKNKWNCMKQIVNVCGFIPFNYGRYYFIGQCKYASLL